jgi:hypothetical protein
LGHIFSGFNLVVTWTKKLIYGVGFCVHGNGFSNFTNGEEFLREFCTMESVTPAPLGAADNFHFIQKPWISFYSHIDRINLPLRTTSIYSTVAKLHILQIATANYKLLPNRFLVTVSNGVDSSASRTQVPSSHPPM